MEGRIFFEAESLARIGESRRSHFEARRAEHVVYLLFHLFIYT
jgi:hypothetical protein